jgi:hypothetical protein
MDIVVDRRSRRDKLSYIFDPLDLFKIKCGCENFIKNSTK